MATGDREDPLMAFRFQVRVDGQAIGGFTEITGLQADIDVQELTEGGVNRFIHKLAGRARFGNLALRRGLVTMVLWDWLFQILSGDSVRKTIAVELLDAGGQQVAMRWVFDSAFPARWIGPELKGEQSTI